jgi:hypothetical protein
MLNTKNLLLANANPARNTLKGREDVNAVDTDGQGAQLSKALWQKYMGPFTLGNQHGENDFELDNNPDHLLVHKTFNVSLFKRCEIDDTRPQVPSPSVRVVKS